MEVSKLVTSLKGKRVKGGRVKGGPRFTQEGGKHKLMNGEKGHSGGG